MNLDDIGYVFLLVSSILLFVSIILGLIAFFPKIYLELQTFFFNIIDAIIGKYGMATQAIILFSFGMILFLIGILFITEEKE